MLRLVSEVGRFRGIREEVVNEWGIAWLVCLWGVLFWAGVGLGVFGCRFVSFVD